MITLGRLTLKPVPWRAVGLLALLALLIAVGLAAYAGSRHRLPAPFGLATNGLVAYADAAGDVYARDLASGRTITIAAGPDFDTDPQFSPDGTKVAFLRRVPAGSGDTYDIVTAAIDGSHATVITSEPIYRGDAPQWAPDSARILANSTLHSDLRLYDATKTAEPVIVATGAGAVADRGAFRPPDGKQILVRRQGTDGMGLYVMNLDGTGVTPLIEIDRAHVRDNDSLGAPTWSPDGSTVAFPLTIERAPDDVRIHIVNADGTNLHELSNAPGKVYENNPTWSPDGTRIAYMRWTHEPGPDYGNILPVAIVGLNGGPIIDTGLQLGGGGAAFDWSPDGSSVLEIPGEAGSRPVLIDPANGAYDQLDFAGDLDSRLSWQRLAR